MQPAGGLSACQDVLCAVVYASNCTSFLYNRLDDACSVFDRKIETPKCDIRSAVPQDNHADCEDPADKCQVNMLKVARSFYLVLA